MRSEFLAAQVGAPWAWTERNCWDFAAAVQHELFGRVLPHVAVPNEPSWRWMIGAVADHPERACWQEVSDGPHGIVTASDGALCLMGRHEGPGHIGVWLKPEGRVIHCDRKMGVAFETVLALRQSGWRSLRFYEPRG